MAQPPESPQTVGRQHHPREGFSRSVPWQLLVARLIIFLEAAVFAVPTGLLRLHHVVANGLVLYEETRLIEQEELGGAEVLGISDLIRCSMQNIKQQWFQNLGRVIPTVEVKRLKTGERKRVLSVVKQKSVLSAAGPAVDRKSVV